MAHNDISHNRRCRSCKYCWSRSACGSIGDAICDYLDATFNYPGWTRGEVAVPGTALFANAVRYLRENPVNHS